MDKNRHVEIARQLADNALNVREACEVTCWKYSSSMGSAFGGTAAQRSRWQ